MYDYGTENFLRNEIANAERFRTELGVKLAGYRTNVDQTEAKIEALNTRITDLARLLDFHERYEAEQAAPGVDTTTEAFVDVADAERYAQRDEYVNAVPDFKPSDLVNISDPGHKLFGTRGSVIGYVYDPDGVVVEYDNLGNTVTVTASQLMHHTEFVKLPDEYFAAAEQTAREAKSVRQIEREIAIEAGDDTEDGEL